MIDIYYSRTGANSFIGINTNKEAFLIDPGYNPGNSLINHIKKLNISLKAILITHGHFDHIYELETICKAFPEVKVYISIDEVDFLNNVDLNLSKDAEVKFLTYIPEHLIKVCDGDIIEEAGFKIKVIATPFHTKGSLCYFIEEEKALFSGDTLFFSTIGRTDLPTGSSRTIDSSLLKLKNLPEGIKVYPGHGACTNLDREKKYNPYLKNI